MTGNEWAVHQAAKSELDGVGQKLIEAVAGQFWRADQVLNNIYYGTMRPSVQYRPRIFIDGNKWCALYGDNLQDGVAGFGDSPSLAMEDFDKAWEMALSTEQGGTA